MATMAESSFVNGNTPFSSTTQGFDVANKMLHLKNYMTAGFWPAAAAAAGFDSTPAAYAAAAYSQASALAAATNGAPSSSSGPSTAVGGSSTSAKNYQSSTNYSPFVSSSTPDTADGKPPLVGPSHAVAAALLNFGAPHSTTGVGSPKKKAQPVPQDLKDSAYWERRRRNNESARRSREGRRAKDEQVAFRVVYLENENLQLRTEVKMLRAEIEKLRLFLCNSQHNVHR